ncbi:phosphatase PAP2 family protein [Paracoccus aerodenitrificans]|uniref:phosphatase PAP2 family protein n=1 Tax=Paracoccus aerodenitrificans TaxID=3017781 RepID=UPI0022F09FC3|nr:phosphatase PAP2 family protein [Paracoccus aerodenitrificans]WBU63450.1 phosphatase PAP2 family protein [Paracoccus aerodenitrificans]
MSIWSKPSRIEPLTQAQHSLQVAWRGLSLPSRCAVIASLMLAVMVLLDQPVLALSNSLDPSIRTLLYNVTKLGNSAWSLLITLALIATGAAAARLACKRKRVALTRLRGAALYLFVTVAISGFLASLSKHMIGRARPSSMEAPEALIFEPMLFRAAYSSFPSGHATTSIALATGLGALFPRHRTAFMVIGIWIAASRALIGVHWFSDVIAGAALGWVTAWLLKHWFARRGIAFRKPVARPVPTPRRFLGTLRRTGQWMLADADGEGSAPLTETRHRSDPA